MRNWNQEIHTANRERIDKMTSKLRRSLQQLQLINEVRQIPQTRYQGSKLKLLPWIWDHIADLSFSSALDAFGGTGSVSFLLKSKGKRVTYNDILKSNFTIGKALIENRSVTLWPKDCPDLTIRVPGRQYDNFVRRTFKDIYFTDEENEWIDITTQNITALENEYQRALAFYALFQASIIKRPYNLFHRANLYMRTSDVERGFGNKVTWDKPFDEHFRNFLGAGSHAVFDSGLECRTENRDVFELGTDHELVYIDPPYMNKNGLGPDYFDFYHFLEGLVQYQAWPERIDQGKKHLPLKAEGKSVWLDKNRVHKAFDDLFAKFSKSILVVSYRNDGVPTAQELHDILKRHKSHIKSFSNKPYKYVLSSNGESHESLLVGI